MQARSLAALGRNPGADVSEVFKRNAASGAFSSFNDRLRQDVIRVRAESPFFAGQFPEPTFGGFGAAPLQTGLASGKTIANAFNVRAGVGSAIAIGGQIDDAKVNAKPVFRLELGCLGDIAGRGEIPLTADKAQIDLAFSVGHKAPLVLAHDDGDRDAALKRPQIDGRAIPDKAQDTIVIGLRGITPETGRDLSVDLVGVRYLGDGAHRYLSGQPEALSERVIGQLVHIELPEHLGLKPGRCQPRRGLVAARERRRQNSGLIRRRQELDGCYQLHALQYRGGSLPMQVLPRCPRPAIPLPPEGGSFSRRPL